MSKNEEIIRSGYAAAEGGVNDVKTVVSLFTAGRGVFHVASGDGIPWQGPGSHGRRLCDGVSRHAPRHSPRLRNERQGDRRAVIERHAQGAARLARWNASSDRQGDAHAVL